ncbi:multidrug ABC transporter permease [Oenococcus oeni]|nr:multidrug ABC transporter permease [Oenococcus oeni]
MLFWLLFASLPIALVGLMISMISNENNREVFSNLLAFPLIIVSGLWWPLDQMPIFLRWIGHFSPVYVLNIGGQRLSDGENIKIICIVNLFIWFFIINCKGIGFDKGKARSTVHGITGIKERLAAVGGKFKIKNGRNGTVATIELFDQGD